MKRTAIVSSCVLLLLLSALDKPASAQTTGPVTNLVLQTNADCSITASFAQAPGASLYLLTVNFNGSPLLFSGLPIVNIPFPAALFGPTALVSSVLPMPPGSYEVRVTPVAGTLSGPTASFTLLHACTGGGTTLAVPSFILPITPVGNNVTLSWTAVPGATVYDIQAVWLQTGQVFTFPVNGTSITASGPPGTYQIRIRARNAGGASPYSDAVPVALGVTLRTGALQVTLTWDQANDIDLHVIEPGGSHVYYASKTGTTAFLDVDNVQGFGPENVYVPQGSAVAGDYQIFIVHYSGSALTNSSITVVTNPGTANERRQTYVRQTSVGNPAAGFNVARANILLNTITEVTGTRSTFDLDMRPKETEPAAAAAGGSR